MSKRGFRKIQHWEKIAILLFLYDLIAVNMAYLLALWLRFDCIASLIPEIYLSGWLDFVPIYSIICAFVFWRCRLYNSIWRFAGFSELLHVILSSVITTVFLVLGTVLFFERMPISYYVFGMGFQFVLVLGIRFSYRLISLESKRFRSLKESDKVATMLIGAGNAGQMILRDSMRFHNDSIDVRCVIDDNPNKWGRYVEGIPVVGGRDDILLNVEKYHIQNIVLAIPSASLIEKRNILGICRESGCTMKNLPGVRQLLEGKVGVSDLREVSMDDLLGREPIHANMEKIYEQIQGKVVLVTGGGGSIGSELCRQVAAHRPKQLIILDVYENNAYDIQQELKEKYPEMALEVLIGSVRDSRRISSIFCTYRPDICYHAAAHKHVPLMEDSPCESIKNNVIGTFKTAYAAMQYGCRRFVLISTDKAVNPTNIMGASKRLCEMVIQSFDRLEKEGKIEKIHPLYTHELGKKEELYPKSSSMRYTTEFVAVRFGNVLGSNGSVIPLFKKQIEKGGPVTVTHPDIIRYFMTIPEAVSLVMQAGTYAKGGEIFVLDMGAPVKIDDLARNLIKLSGHKPDTEIPIVYTGLRPGEKLYEEKLMAEEGLLKTESELIHIGKPLEFDVHRFMDQLKVLMDAAYANDPQICNLVQQVVTTYYPDRGAAAVKDAAYEKLEKQMETKVC